MEAFWNRLGRVSAQAKRLVFLIGDEVKLVLTKPVHASAGYPSPHPGLLPSQGAERGAAWRLESRLNPQVESLRYGMWTKERVMRPSLASQRK